MIKGGKLGHTSAQNKMKILSKAGAFDMCFRKSPSEPNVGLGSIKLRNTSSQPQFMPYQNEMISSVLPELQEVVQKIGDKIKKRNSQ